MSTIVNPRYKKSGVHSDTFPHDFFLKIPCGKCPECLKRKANDWKIRLHYEYLFHCKHPLRSGEVLFVTLSISPRYYKRIYNDPHKYLRRFYERYRRRFGVSIRHWITTELGKENDRLHFHGILFGFKGYPSSVYRSITKNNRLLRQLWKYGNTWIGDQCDDQTIGYIVKYTRKIYKCKDGSIYRPLISASPGLGKSFLVDFPDVLKKDACQRLMFFGNYRYCVPRYYFNKVNSDAARFADSVKRFFNIPPGTWKYSFGKHVFQTAESYWSFIRDKYSSFDISEFIRPPIDMWKYINQYRYLWDLTCLAYPRFAETIDFLFT